MLVNFLDRIGDWNPQLLREIKGRLKVFPVLISCGVSLIGQLILFLFQLGDLPGEKYSMSAPYCRVGVSYREQLTQLYPQINRLQQQISVFSKAKNATKVQEFTEKLEQLKAEESNLNKILYNQFCPSDQINMQLWWRDHWEYIFLTLSVVFIFTLLVAGTYLLINNLAQEEHRGTLNFLRLSPQSEVSILTGKMLGVPILIYLAVTAAIPLHLIAGRSANIAFSNIFSFYILLVASCIFFYSIALLFGFFSRFFSGFQPWLGSGTVLIFLIFTLQMAYASPSYLDNAAPWLKLLSPLDMTGYLFPNLFHRYRWEELEKLQFFYLPVGKNLVGLLSVHLVNYGLLTYWIWQGLKRRFRNPNAAMLSKGQSYLLVACSQVIMWGFTLQYVENHCPPGLPYKPSICYYDLNQQISQQLALPIFFNLLLLFGLIAILSPHRQAVQDWARYRHQNVSSRKGFWQNSLLQDLILSEKSPALVAMAINLVIASTPFVIWILLAPALNVNHTNSVNWLINEIGRLKAILGVGLFITLMMIYATIAQKMLMMKTIKRSFWAIGIVAAAIFLPPMILGMLGIQASETPILWLFSTFPWAGLEHASKVTIFMALLGEFSVLVLLNLQLTRQVRLAGESATKALLAET